MNKTLRLLRGSRPPLGCLGALALILAVESFIVRDKDDTMDGSLWTYDSSREIAARKVKDCGILAFGDSLMKHGVAPRVLKDRTGLEGYNFAIAGSQVPASYFLFREALQSGARPKAVLLDVFPCLLTSDPWANIMNWPIVASYRDCLTMAWLGRDPRLLASLMVRKTVPSIRCRESIRAAILESLKGFGGVSKSGIQVALRNWEVNRGLAIDAYRHNPNITLDFWVGQLFQPIQVSEINRYYLDQFLKTAAQHHVKVFLVLPPYMPELQAKLEQIGWDAEHQKFVQSILDRHPGVDVLDARKSNVEPYVFIDTHHLGYQGASTFSGTLGDLLRQKLTRPDSMPRWVFLPTYTRQPITVWHESPEESRTAVLQANSQVRR